MTVILGLLCNNGLEFGAAHGASSRIDGNNASNMKGLRESSGQSKKLCWVPRQVTQNSARDADLQTGDC